MKLLSLHIDGFGKFHDRDVLFHDGLNIVYGKNEAGKSTLFSFIKGMLFGIERGRGRASKNDTYTRFEPWTNSGSYEGWLRLESGGEIYRIERRFQKSNKRLAIIQETTGRELEPTAALLNRLRCGLSETAYDNTISIGQLKSATDRTMVSELRNYIANLNTSGSIALNITKASALLKSQRRSLENRMFPEAAKNYTTTLSEIRKLEQEISSPGYANQLTACLEKKAQLKQTREERQKEKELLLEKNAKAQQMLSNSPFFDEESTQNYLQEVNRYYQDYENDRKALGGRSFSLKTGLLFFLSAIIAGCSAATAQFAFKQGQSAFFALTAAFILVALLPLSAAISRISKASRIKKRLNDNTRILKEIFNTHIGTEEISENSVLALKERLFEYNRLSNIVAQSEEALKNLSDEIENLQETEENCDLEIEKQQRIQWQLEQKLEQLDELKTKRECLKHVITENGRIQEELDAIDLAQETMTTLSSSIRDSFGLYLNKTASELIGSITGGIYTSLSIDQNLDVYMNTPTRLVPIEQVSSGTMDQIYLAVRLAAAELMKNKNEETPLIFDDSFSLYDDERLKTTLKWLSTAFTCQMILFTCHKREETLLKTLNIPYHIIHI